MLRLQCFNATALQRYNFQPLHPSCFLPTSHLPTLRAYEPAYPNNSPSNRPKGLQPINPSIHQSTHNSQLTTPKHNSIPNSNIRPSIHPFIHSFTYLLTYLFTPPNFFLNKYPISSHLISSLSLFPFLFPQIQNNHTIYFSYCTL